MPQTIGTYHHPLILPPVMQSSNVYQVDKNAGHTGIPVAYVEIMMKWRCG